MAMAKAMLPRSLPPLWMIVLGSLVCLSLIGAYVYSPGRYTGCYMSTTDCNPFKDWLPPIPARVLNDDELASRAVIRDILLVPPVKSMNPKIAFMFLTPGSLPFEKLWEKFFAGQEGRFSIYVHASREKPVHMSRLFIGRDIHSEKVVWGKISMVDAEKRLLGNALQDVDNQHFVLLSDSCVPLHSFDYVFNYLMQTNISFIDCFEDPGPHGSFRYSKLMLPEVQKEEFRKGSQWFSVKRQHAVLILADNLYYTKFRLHCKMRWRLLHNESKSFDEVQHPGFKIHDRVSDIKPGMENGRNCYADEHYLPTLFHMVDPTGVSNWSVTHVDWSEGKWHPKAYRAKDITYELLKNISSIDESYHVTSNENKVVMQKPCMWNGVKRPCYLFARKFYPEALDNLLHLFPNITRN